MIQPSCSYRPMIAALTALLLLMPQLATADQTVVMDSQLLQQMQETVRKQQELLQQQSEQLKLQSESLNALQQKINAMHQKAVTPDFSAVSPQTINPGSGRIRLSVSGQIDRALNIINDGGPTKLYHIDNNASNSRFRLVGNASINGDMTLGTRIELAVSPDNSGRVSQKNPAPADFFRIRWAEVSLLSRTFGKLSLGKGNTASKDTATQDLSRTDLVQYASISAVAGGMFFRNAGASHILTSIRVADAFRGRDGLGRDSRLRYDSPQLSGFTLAGSISTKQCSDLAVFWGGEGYGLKAAGAAAVANPRISGSGLLYDGSFSLLHTASGLNLTVSSALQKRTIKKDATNFYAKLGWIAGFTDMGATAFGLDYTISGNMPSSDDRGYSIGAAVVQSFERYATEVYLQYRNYSLKRANGIPLEDMQVSTIGVRIKF